MWDKGMESWRIKYIKGNWMESLKGKISLNFLGCLGYLNTYLYQVSLLEYFKKKIVTLIVT